MKRFYHATKSNKARTAKRPRRASYKAKPVTRSAFNHLASLLGVENKYYDTQLTSFNIPSATNMAGLEADPATVLCLSAPAQGDGPTNREGRRITIQSIEVDGVVTQVPQTAQTAADVSPTVTVWLILDKQTNATQLNSEDVFSNPSGQAALSATPLRNMQFSTRFTVLAKKEIKMQMQTMVAQASPNHTQSGQTHAFHIYKDLNDLTVLFNDATTVAGIQNVTDNSLHIIATQSGSPSGTVVASQLFYNARIRFRG